MVKLMANKSKALPAAHSLEEWHAQALQRYSATGGSSGAAFLVTPHNAALRIQLRYRVYKEKVRALIKKGQAKDDGNGKSSDAAMHEAAAVAGSVKTAVRERGAKASSVALAVAYKTRKDPLVADGAALPPLVAQNSKAPNAGGAPEIPRPSIQDATSWGSDDWSVPSRGFVAVPKPQDEEEDTDDSKRDTKSFMSEEPKIRSASVSDAHGHTLMGDFATSEDALVVARGDHKFVDVMHPSWLLATVEERCAEAAASLGSRGQHGAHRHITMLDLRHTVLDLLFSARSGVNENLHGRAPSSTHEHRRKLVQRLAASPAPSASGEVVSMTLDEAARRRVHRIFDALKSDMVMPAVRCLGWMLSKTWRVLFSGLHVDVESLHRVRQALEAAGNVSVVFTPTHETHLDYLIISYLCFAYGIPLPRIAAGNNLDLPVIGSFLRANGSFFIRRSFKDDQLYKDVLQNYVHELLADGNPIEVFIEGGRSRHGRVCKPKMGFLNMFRAFVDAQAAKAASSEEETETAKDVLLVPISLDYDRVFEVEEYANQLLGKPKQKESLKVFFESLWDMLFVRCGHCYVRFGEPVSMKERESLRDTAQTLAVRMQTCGTVTSTAVVAALLMWTRAYTTRDMLVARARWLVAELELRGATVAHHESAEALVAHALTVLNVDVTPQGVVHSKVSFPTRALELGFYRNHLLHVFLPDMALLGAIDALRVRHTASGASSVSLLKSEVLAEASFLWRFLRHICRHDDVDLAQHLEALELRVPALRVSSDDVRVSLAPWRASRVASFALSLHWSFVDSLWLATLAVWTLASKTETVTAVPEREMLRLAQFVARELAEDARLAHAEAFCSESIKQAFEFLHEHGVLRFTPCATTGARLYALAEETTEMLAAVQSRVSASRKPRTFLYREDQPAAALSRDETLALAARAAAEAQAASDAHSGGRARARAGVYASWMSH